MHVCLLSEDLHPVNENLPGPYRFNLLLQCLHELCETPYLNMDPLLGQRTLPLLTVIVLRYGTAHIHCSRLGNNQFTKKNDNNFAMTQLNRITVLVRRGRCVLLRMFNTVSCCALKSFCFHSGLFISVI